MTDKEIMYHRFCRKNLRRSTGELAKYLGMSRKDYEDAVRRGMEQETLELKQQNNQKTEVPLIDKEFVKSGGLYDFMNDIAVMHDIEQNRKNYI